MNATELFETLKVEMMELLETHTGVKGCYQHSDEAHNIMRDRLKLYDEDTQKAICVASCDWLTAHGKWASKSGNVVYALHDAVHDTGLCFGDSCPFADEVL